MKIWLIQRAEPLPVDEGKQRLLRTGILAETLMRKGHEVLWWTSTFNHYQKKHRSDKDVVVDVSGNYRIRMLKGTGYGKNISLARVLDQRIVARKFRRFSKDEAAPDIIVCSLPTVELCLAGAEYAREKGIPVVIDTRDMWPDIFVDVFPRPLRRLIRAALSPMFHEAERACSMATAIWGITEPFVEWGLKRAGRERTDMDRSFPMGYVAAEPDARLLKESEKYWDERGIQKDGKELIVCFSGSLSWQFDVGTAILAVRKLASEGKLVKLVVCGLGERLGQYERMAAGEDRIVLTGWVNAAKLHVLMRRASLGLDPMPDRYDYLATINNKAIEYMSAGLPVISCPKNGVLYDVLREHGCGMSYEHGDVGALAALLRELSDDREKLKRMSENSSRLFRDNFTAEKVYGEMVSCIEDIVERSKRPEFKITSKGVR